MGSVGQNSTVSEYGHVQNMVMLHVKLKRITNAAIWLPADPPTHTPHFDPLYGVSRSKFNFFQNMVMLHIKLKRITNGETWLPADPLHTLHTPSLGMGSVGQNATVSEYGHDAYQIKENQECSNMVANILHTDPPPPWE